jgi:large subunit ribosomal protein L27
MAHKKAGGSTGNIRDSQGQRLGVKLFAGQFARVGAIIVRQRGSKIRPGVNVKISNDDSLFAIKTGYVRFRSLKRRRFDGSLKHTKYVDVIDKEIA